MQNNLCWQKADQKTHQIKTGAKKIENEGLEGAQQTFGGNRYVQWPWYGNGFTDV